MGSNRGDAGDSTAIVHCEISILAEPGESHLQRNNLEPSHEYYRLCAASKPRICEEARSKARVTASIIPIVTCMDPRLSNLPEILCIPHADIDVIRTGGPAVTEDVFGELVVSNRILGTRETVLLNHTGCGFTTFTDDEMNARLSSVTGGAVSSPTKTLRGTREQIKAGRSHPWIAKDVPVRGFVLNMEAGLLSEVLGVPQ